MSAAQRCFNNSLVVQNIINDFDVSEVLQFRFINKTCNKELLRQMRNSYRKVRVVVANKNLPKIKVNGLLVKYTDCFKFLIDTVGVKVEELEVVTVGRLHPAAARKVHDCISNVLIKDGTLKVFKGMRSLCNESCDRCFKKVIQSKEYGPVKLRVPRNFFEEPKHFDKLIVDDQLFWEIAIKCHNAHNCRRGQLRKMKSLISSRISCDHLQILLYDDLEFKCPLPREILEEVCRTWKARSVGITFQSQKRFELFRNLKQASDRFTKLNWDSPYETTPFSTGFLLDYVEVDLEKAPVQFNGVFGSDGSRHMANYEVIANIRRVLPAKHYYFNGHRLSEKTAVERYPGMINNARLGKILYAAMRGTSPSNNVPVTIRHYIKGTSTFPMFSIKMRQGYTCSVSEQPISYVFEGSERIGSSFKFQEEATGCEVNLEIYMNKNTSILCEDRQKAVDSVRNKNAVSLFGSVFATLAHLMSAIQEGDRERR